MILYVFFNLMICLLYTSVRFCESPAVSPFTDDEVSASEFGAAACEVSVVAIVPDAAVLLLFPQPAAKTAIKAAPSTSADFFLNLMFLLLDNYCYLNKKTTKAAHRMRCVSLRGTEFIFLMIM